jgi:2-polyprenyl-3-methyl-5-hydroxy-6-metoxy-1,4-benzoquinol methylase
MLSNYYNTSESWKFWNDYIFPSSEETRREKIFIPRVKRVIDLCRANNVKNELLLDVGAGFGTFCEEIIKLDYFKKVIAVEPTPDLAESCRRKGISVIELPIEKVSMETVDLITNFELIEHLFCPKDFLISCNRALSNNGLLILTTPNIKGFDLLLLEELSDNVGGPNHLNYFHPDSLKILFKNTGFNIIEILTPGKLDAELVRKKVLSGVFDISNNKFLKQILIDGWGSLSKKFQEFLALNNLSSHLWVVAKKIA